MSEIGTERLLLDEVRHLLSPVVLDLIKDKDMKFTDVFLMEIIIQLRQANQPSLPELFNFLDVRDANPHS